MSQNNISLETAQDWARTFRLNPSNIIIGHLIPRIDLEQLLSCKGGLDVRAYYGIDDRGEQKLMLVSVDAMGNDLINEKLDQLIYDQTTSCPPSEDINSPLNTL